MKPLLFLVFGLLAGAVGGGLFVRSLPPATPAEELQAELQYRLNRAENRIRELENLDDISERMTVDESRERARDILRKIRNGETITLDDFFRAFQPALRDTAPIFNRLRILEQTERFDSLLGQYTRKYDLNPAQQRRLKDWFENKARENSRRFDDVIYDDNATVFDLIAATEDDRRSDAGIEWVMREVLDPADYRDFYTERIAERAEQVQREADGKLARLGNIVELREDQKDDLFVAFAKGSDDYDPAMAIEGVSESSAYVEPGDSTYDAIYSVLDDDQTRTLRAETERRRREENKRLAAVGLALPESWDPLELTSLHSF